MKTCTRCGETFPATAEYFPKTKQTKSGLVNYCKGCHAARLREWQRQNHDKVKAYLEKHFAKDPERVRQYSRDYKARQRLKRKDMDRQMADMERRITVLEAKLNEVLP